MENINNKGMLVQSFGAMRVVVIESTSKRPTVGMGCFAKVAVGGIIIVEYYNWTLFSLNLYRRQQDHRILGRGALSVGVWDFQTYSVHI